MVNLICENCETEHNGSYGSGRFCTKTCARGFSTKTKRQEINKKVSETLKGRPTHTTNGFKKGFDSRRKKFSEEERLKGVKVRLSNIQTFYLTASWDELPLAEKRRRVLKEQNGKCKKCGTNPMWQDEELVLELDHIDGNNKNNDKDNLRILCPNCHSQTPTYRRKKRFLAV